MFHLQQRNKQKKKIKKHSTGNTALYREDLGELLSIQQRVADNCHFQMSYSGTCIGSHKVVLLPTQGGHIHHLARQKRSGFSYLCRCKSNVACSDNLAVPQHTQQASLRHPPNPPLVRNSPACLCLLRPFASEENSRSEDKNNNHFSGL